MKPFLIRDLPEEERPRERLLQQGASALAERELLAILLRSGRKGQSAIDFAADILAKSNGLPGLSHYNASQLRKLYGLGHVQAIMVEAALELARRTRVSNGTRSKFDQPGHVRRYLEQHYKYCSQEMTNALLLDVRNRLIRDVECYRGTIDRAMVEPRGILRQALVEDAVGVILYHNHPSGDPSPSAEDIEFTRRFMHAAEMVGVRFLDHMIVGTEGIVSLRERGLI